MRDDSVPGERATLVVELADGADDAAFADAVADLGGAVEAELRFDSYRIVVDETAVAQLCGLSGLAVVETDNAVGYGGDAGEDVDGGVD